MFIHSKQYKVRISDVLFKRSVMVHLYNDFSVFSNQSKVLQFHNLKQVNNLSLIPFNFFQVQVAEAAFQRVLQAGISDIVFLL